MKQLDWITEVHKIPCEGVVGINIWQSEEGFYGEPDLECEFLGMKGSTIRFYVINGAWYGELDVVSKTIYIEFTEDTVPYHKFEFIYENDKKVVDIDNITY